MEPLVSILIPAYNASRWIQETIESALAQSWARKEIIVVDDGSFDHTREIVESYRGRGVALIAQQHQGAAAARNRAYAQSQGDYVQWLDADDLLGREKISRQVALLIRRGSKRTLASGPWAHFRYRPARAVFRPNALWEDSTPVDWLVRKLSLNLHMQTGTWLIPRELADAAGLWNTTLLGDDDGEYSCRLLLNCDGIRFEPRARLYYRSISSNRLSYIGHSDAKKDAQFASMKLHIQYLRTMEDSERARAAGVTYLQNWLIHFFPERRDIVERAKTTARELGGELREPELSWKYRWVKELFGWKVAKRVQVFLPALRQAAASSLDHLMARLEEMARNEPRERRGRAPEDTELTAAGGKPRSKGRA